MYIDSTFYGLVPDGDQVVAQELRDSLEDLLYRYQVGALEALSGYMPAYVFSTDWLLWCAPTGLAS